MQPYFTHVAPRAHSFVVAAKYPVVGRVFGEGLAMGDRIISRLRYRVGVRSVLVGVHDVLACDIGEFLGVPTPEIDSGHGQNPFFSDPMAALFFEHAHDFLVWRTALDWGYTRDFG